MASASLGGVRAQVEAPFFRVAVHLRRGSTAFRLIGYGPAAAVLPTQAAIAPRRPADLDHARGGQASFRRRATSISCFGQERPKLIRSYRQIVEKVPAPARNVMFQQVIHHRFPTLLPLFQRHAQRARNGVCGTLYVVWVDEKRFW